MNKQKIAVVFPGQGSQFPGMSQPFLDSQYGEIARPIFAMASEVLGYDALELSLNDPESKLNQTEMTQPMIVLHSVLSFNLLKGWLEKKGIEVDLVLGHSVGEYSALVAAGVLTLESALSLTKQRGKAMQEATPIGVGKMVAVLRVPADIITKACQTAETETGEVVSPANFNSPLQTVISGTVKGCDRAVEIIQKLHEGRSRFVELPVSAPFHCPLMDPAISKMEKAFAESEFLPNKIAYCANVDAHLYAPGTESVKIQDNLLKQISAPVRWVESVNAISNKNLVIEVAPGKVLQGLIKKINKDLRVFSFGEESDLTKVFETLENTIN